MLERKRGVRTPGVRTAKQVLEQCWNSSSGMKGPKPKHGQVNPGIPGFWRCFAVRQLQKGVLEQKKGCWNSSVLTVPGKRCSNSCGKEVLAQVF